MIEAHQLDRHPSAFPRGSPSLSTGLSITTRVAASTANTTQMPPITQLHVHSPQSQSECLSRANEPQREIVEGFGLQCDRIISISDCFVCV